MSAVVLILKSGVFAAVIDRFAELATSEPGGTFRFRLILWNNALRAFWDYPFIGVGPGGFKHLHEIYPDLRLHPTFTYLRIMTAHNLLFHYLAEAGLVGGIGVVAMFVNKLRIARRSWLLSLDSTSPALAIYGSAFLFLLSAFIDAAWLYGQLSFLAVFFAALIARQHRELRRIKS